MSVYIHSDHKIKEGWAVKKNNNKNIAKVSNDMLEAYVKNINAVALKVLLYIAKNNAFDVETLHELRDEEIVGLNVNINDMLRYCNITLQTLNRNIKKMTETSIKIADKKGEGYITLLPYCKMNYDGSMDIKIFAGILKMTHALSSFSLVDVSTFALIKKAHTIRMLMILNRIGNFSENVAKRKRYKLEELNQMFDTKYQNIPEFVRRVLEPAKKELDQKSNLTFLYQTKKDKLEKNVGRAKVVEVIIDLIKKNKNQQNKKEQYPTLEEIDRENNKINKLRVIL